MAVPINLAGAVSAYAKAPTAAQPGMVARDAQQPSQFAQLVRGAIDQAVQIGKTGEQVSIAAINDRADMNQVVTAIAEAEVTLQTVVTVRDKIIDAYKEILRMPV